MMMRKGSEHLPLAVGSRVLPCPRHALHASCWQKAPIKGENHCRLTSWLSMFISSSRVRLPLNRNGLIHYSDLILLMHARSCRSLDSTPQRVSGPCRDAVLGRPPGKGVASRLRGECWTYIGGGSEQESKYHARGKFGLMLSLIFKHYFFKTNFSLDEKHADVTGRK